MRIMRRNVMFHIFSGVKAKNTESRTFNLFFSDPGLYEPRGYDLDNDIDNPPETKMRPCERLLPGLKTMYMRR